MQPPSPSKEREFKGEGVSISAKNIVIATGSSAMKLEIDGVDEKDILTNHEIFEQTGDIKNLVIIGGGYI
jgi:pyruvate/2-oxoglutarate dehydrogenase complex dihydrolipoamide dehydrogenase (E3) component